MKELSIEEKAKRHDDLLVKLQEAKVDNNVCDERYCCVIDDIVPELKESEDEKIVNYLEGIIINDIDTSDAPFTKKAILSCLEKMKSNPYTGVGFKYNGQTWGMCARDEGVDILVDSKLISHIDIRQGEQKPWSEEVEAAITLLKDIAEEQEKDYCPHNANDLRKAAQILETCRPQNKWTPSEEQMQALEYFIINHNEHTGYAKDLEEIRQNLKKLKE